MGRSRSCAVEGCGRNGVEDLPLTGDSVLDVAVCAAHARAIEAHPSRWRLTSVPIRGTTKSRMVVVGGSTLDP